MSDTFDHEGDAWASLDDREDEHYSQYHRGHVGSYRGARHVRCNRCDAICTWCFANARWRLMEGRALHDCGTVQDGEFEDLTKS